MLLLIFVFIYPVAKKEVFNYCFLTKNKKLAELLILCVELLLKIVIRNGSTKKWEKFAYNHDQPTHFVAYEF